MMDNLYLFCVGTAAVLDTVLLIALLETRNRRRAILPALILLASFGLWHVGAFSQLLLSAMAGPWAEKVRWFFRIVTAAGLLLIPGSLLHGVIWLRDLNGPAPPAHRGRVLLAYLPAILIVPIAVSMPSDPAQSIVPLARAWLTVYVAWFCAASVYCALGFLRLHGKVEGPHAASFSAWMAGTLLLAAAVIAALHFLPSSAQPEARRHLQLAVVLLPVFPAVLFALYVIRYNFLGLALERTLVYGAILLGALLFHEVAVRDLTTALADRFKVDFAIIEGIAGTGLILAYQPFRQRASEALRYLLGARVHETRDSIRQLAVQMSTLAGQPPEELVGWFVDRIRAPLKVDYARGWLLGENGEVTARRGDGPAVEEGRLADVYREMAGRQVCSRLDAPGPATRECARAACASLILKLAPQDRAGLIFLGRRRGNRDYSEEEVNSLLLLAEQLASTLRNSHLQAERLAAERRALQNEKLSALGLLASSIAHEVKNPLSSIKTIATVLGEELGPGSEHQKDLKLIVHEIDRLSRRTEELLEFARPGKPAGPASLAGVVEKTLGVLRHLAKQWNVAIDLRLDNGALPVRADEATLGEIVFNLLSNSIEAASEARCAGGDARGRVEVTLKRAQGRSVLEVHDNGPGIPPEIQDHIFEPFFTTKESGTGLGLYVVSRRVRELQGEIHCESSADQGTSFTVKLPEENDHPNPTSR
jgi:signal transduction histidine kinase